MNSRTPRARRGAPYYTLVCAILGILVTTSAVAWGPKTQLSIVTTALHLLSKDGNIPLDRLERDLQMGAVIPMESLRNTYPSLDLDPISALEPEIFLLQAVRSDRVDPYFAYRLGVLGKLVAEATSPMRSVDPTYRNLYFADVDRRIETVTLKMGPRQVVDPKAYFPLLIEQANVHNDAIQRDYQAALGFGGLAGSLLAEDASRSVNAIADVWHTILSRRTQMGGVSEKQRQGYVLDAYAFYIPRRNPAEIEAADARLATLAKRTPEMNIQIGDLFYRAEFYDHAMAAYREALAAAPEQRNVIEKIANYYVERGAAALKQRQLESALEAFQAALDADPMHPTAERERLQVAAMIAAREARLAAARDALERAKGAQNLAEQEAMNGRYAESFSLFRQATDAYQEVTDEFPTERQQSERGLNDVRYRMQQLKEDLMANARSFSGSGIQLDPARLARTRATDIEQQALRELTQASLAAALEQLQADMQRELALP